MGAKKIPVHEFSHERAIAYIKNRHSVEYDEDLDDNGHLRITKKDVPALFFSEYSFGEYRTKNGIELTDSTNFYIIRSNSKPIRKRWIDYVFFDDWQAEQRNPAWQIFRVLLQWNQDIVSIKGKDLGEGMARVREIILANGDSPEWTRVDFETFSNEGKVLKAFIDVAIDKSSRIFDFQRKCWFISTDVIKPLLEGINSLIKQGSLPGYFITDNRETIETFEDFFNKQTEGGYKSTPPKPKAVLLKELEHIFKNQANLMISIREDCKIADLKPSYRKAAMVLHPDRNNGDGSRMSHLNLVWKELQEYI